ncbi:MAG: ABC transporter ATP-binding protein [Bifidobacteriaceae bacterium]|jgi:peptide/nickel transport system ATP-binding protein|nr:ABC transporter ATP-binding protein [Bifidobacteriaceae bacterium]
MALLSAQDVYVNLPTEDGMVHAVQGVSFEVRRGEIFGIVGESGSGKSVLTQAITGLLPGSDIAGRVLFDGADLITMSARQLRQLRGKRIGMVFQDPLSSLHPYFTIGSQITEVIRIHERSTSRSAAKRRAVEMLETVGIPNAAKRFNDYPHQFSGGMRQRVMIAMALVLRPDFIIADEPTTALDVTIQKQILTLLSQMRDELGATVIMISHDLGLLASFADRAMVMYAGHQMETGPISSLFTRPAHPYTAGLLRSSPTAEESNDRLIPIQGKAPSLLAVPTGCAFAPRCADAVADCFASRPVERVYDDGVTVNCLLHHDPGLPEPVREVDAFVTAMQRDGSRVHVVDPRRHVVQEPVVEVTDMRLSFRPKSRHPVHVLKGISLRLEQGDALGLVGESGCGKTTLARAIAGLIPATSGSIRFLGREIGQLNATEWRQMRQHVQMVFQDPYGSLNPRRRVGAIIGEPLRIQKRLRGAPLKSSVQELMELVGLDPEHYNRFPSEFSGGQRQRIGIARALALDPQLVIFDEPVSALDVSIQAQILNLIKDLRAAFGYTYLFISHDLAVVRHVCDRIAVMDGGEIIELAATETIFGAPQADFTKKLLAASVFQQPTAGAENRLLLAERPGPKVLSDSEVAR